MARPRPSKYIPTLAYLRVSTQEQSDSGAGLAAQRAAIDAFAERSAIEIDEYFVDAGVSGSVAPADRPRLAEALLALGAARSGILLVAKSDRIARRAADLLNLCTLAERQGWSVVAADGTVDQTTAHGRFLTTVMAGAAELERDLIRSRTKDALAAKKAAGVRLGRPVTLPEQTRERIGRERAAGATLQTIADRLNAEEIPTARGGAAWRPSSVAAVIRSLELDAQARLGPSRAATS